MRILLMVLLAQAAAPKPPERRPQTPPVASPELAADRRVTFRLRAPQAKEVVVTGQWTKEKVKLTRDADGLWSATTGPVEPGLWEYSFVVDGYTSVDPGNPAIKPQRWPKSSLLEVPGSPPLISEFQNVPHGTVRVHQYDSKVIGRLRRLHVYTPPDYDKKPGVKYPTLYLQHGHSDNDAAWTVAGHANYILDNLIAQNKARPMVVVMMDGHATRPEYPDDVQRIGDNTVAFGKELLTEVMPFIQANYRVRTDADSRAIVGLSMGGGQSLTIGLQHPETFAWVGGFSSAAPAESAIADALKDPKALQKKLRWLWVGCGKEDFLLKRNQDFVALLQGKGIQPIWHLSEGGHAWPVWRSYLVEIAPQLFAPAPKRRS